MNKRIFLDWDEIEKQCNILVLKIPLQKYKNVFGISRGGLIPAVMISHKTELPLITDEYRITKNTLIIDEINDSGSTIKKFKSDTATLYQRYSTGKESTYYSTLIKNDSWLVFPWENIKYFLKLEKNKNYMKKYNQRKGVILKRKKYQKEYNKLEKNKIKTREYQKKHYDKNKHSVNIKIRRIIGSRVAKLLKRNNTKKKHTICAYLGISIPKYKSYLESQFDENMSWDNYGSYWEIDHIKQLCTFDLSNLKQQKIAFNYKNTRPLEKTANRKRSKRQ